MSIAGILHDLGALANAAAARPDDALTLDGSWNLERSADGKSTEWWYRRSKCAFGAVWLQAVDCGGEVVDAWAWTAPLPWQEGDGRVVMARGFCASREEAMAVVEARTAWGEGA